MLGLAASLLLKRMEEMPRQRKQLLGMRHLGRFARREELACAIVFLSSDDASCISGLTLPMEGVITHPRNL